MNYTESKKKMLGENIWMRRESMSMSRDELADRLGIIKDTLSKWENGHITPSKDNLSKLTKIFKCSKHELHRPCSIPKISLIETKEVVERKEEPTMCDADMIRAASEVFKNAYVESSVDSVKDNINTEDDIQPTKEEIYKQKIIARTKKYLSDNNMAQLDLSRKIPMSTATLNRAIRNVLPCNSIAYKRIEEYLNNVEANANTNESANNICLTEVKITEPIKEEHKAEIVTEKDSIANRFNRIYDTLFNAMAELDELRNDIVKIEKATSLLKEIKGL